MGASGSRGTASPATGRAWRHIGEEEIDHDRGCNEDESKTVAAP